MFSIVFFLVEEKKDASTRPFFAKIITTDEYEMQNKQAHQLIQPAQKPPLIVSKPAKPKLAPSETGTNMRRNKTAPVEKDSSSDKTQESLVSAQTPQANKEPGISKKSTGEYSQESQQDMATSRPSRGSGDRLFDTDIIAKLPQKERERAKPDKGITFNTREFKYYGYLQRLREKIEGIWKYPVDAAEKGIYGDLYLRFTIKKNGKLGAVELIRTSGHKILDDAAIKALKDAEPFWPLPEEWGTEGFTITGHFVYSIYGSYLR